METNANYIDASDETETASIEGVSNRFKHSRDEKEIVEDETCSNQPPTFKTTDNIE